MNEIKVIFKIIVNDTSYTVGDYVQVVPKDLYKTEVASGYITSESTQSLLVLDDDLMFINKIPFNEIAEIKPFI